MSQLKNRSHQITRLKKKKKKENESEIIVCLLTPSKHDSCISAKHDFSRRLIPCLRGHSHLFRLGPGRGVGENEGQDGERQDSEQAAQRRIIVQSYILTLLPGLTTTHY